MKTVNQKSSVNSKASEFRKKPLLSIGSAAARAVMNY
jgi:hypothetical protein